MRRATVASEAAAKRLCREAPTQRENRDAFADLRLKINVGRRHEVETSERKFKGVRRESSAH
jgi:hypothetical protein